MRTFVALFAILFSGTAMAIGSGEICGGISDRDGIACDVRYVDGMGDTLYIRVNVKKSDGEASAAAAKAAMRKAVNAFMLAGGTFIKMRTTRPDGVEVERLCSRIKHRKTENCGDWAPVKG